MCTRGFSAALCKDQGSPENAVLVLMLRMMRFMPRFLSRCCGFCILKVENITKNPTRSLPIVPALCNVILWFALLQPHQAQWCFSSISHQGLLHTLYTVLSGTLPSPYRKYCKCRSHHKSDIFKDAPEPPPLLFLCCDQIIMEFRAGLGL